MKHEAHITCHIDYAPIVRDIGERLKWKFSAIDGDALMGDKPFCYLTAYEPDPVKLYQRMQDVTAALFNEAGIIVLRLKIERIIYDTKTELDEVTALLTVEDRKLTPTEK